MNVVKLTQAPAGHLHELEFADIFWPAYPNKKARPKALKAWRSARKRASLETIMDGLEQYKRCKEDWRAWMHPATFLNGDCWEDEYETNDFGKYDQ